MKRTMVHLDEKQYEALWLIAKKKKKPFSAVVRDAVDSYLRKYSTAVRLLQGG